MLAVAERQLSFVLVFPNLSRIAGLELVGENIHLLVHTRHESVNEGRRVAGLDHEKVDVRDRKQPVDAKALANPPHTSTDDARHTVHREVAGTSQKGKKDFRGASR